MGLAKCCRFAKVNNDDGNQLALKPKISNATVMLTRTRNFEVYRVHHCVFASQFREIRGIHAAILFDQQPFFATARFPTAETG